MDFVLYFSDINSLSHYSCCYEL